MLGTRAYFTAVCAAAVFMQFGNAGTTLPGIPLAMAASGTDTPRPTGSGSATETAKPVTWPPLRFGQLENEPDGTPRHVIVTMAVGADAATNAEIAIELAAQLQKSVHGRKAVNHSIVVPTTLTLEDLLKQCAVKGSALAGAYVALPQAVTSASDNYVFFTRSWSLLSFATAVIECNAKDGGGDGPAVTWVSSVSRGLGNRNSVSLSPLAALASIYAVLTPSKTSTSVTTRVYPTTTPLAVRGEISQTQTTNTTTTNPSAANSVGTTLLGLFGSQSANIGAIPSVSAQTSQAIRGSVIAFSLHVNAVCAAVAANQTPVPFASTVPVTNTVAVSSNPIGEAVSDQLPAKNPGFCSW
jgi:hypothetical protein